MGKIEGFLALLLTGYTEGYQQPQHGQYPPQAPPPQHGYSSSPAPGYGQQQGYPPPGQQTPGYPAPHQPYGAPSHSPYPQQQYNAPSGQYQQQPYGAPAQGQYGAPSQDQYGAPPQGHYGAPPQGQYNAPQAQYGASTPGQYPPQQQQYGGPPQAPYGAAPQAYGAPSGPPTHPSPGYSTGQKAHFDASRQADDLRKAMKGLGTDEAALIRVLAQAGPLEIPAFKESYQQRHRRSLESDIKSETGGYFELGLMSILMGPLQHDVVSVHDALKGAGTKESLLDDVLIGRSNADMNAIKQTYQHLYHRSLESDVRADLSAKTERMYMMIIGGTRQEDSAPIIPQSVDADVAELHRATEGKHGTEQLTVCSILTNRSDAHIRAIAHAYEQRYRLSLEAVLKKEFSGHMEDALVRMVRSGTDRAMRDAIALEDCMKGPGTKDQMLVSRIVRIHWDRTHTAQVKGAYRAKFSRDLIDRIRGETSGDYAKLLIAMVGV